MTYRTHSPDQAITYQPYSCQRRARMNGVQAAVPPEVITLIEGLLRNSLSAATTTYCQMVHTGSIAEAGTAACERRAHTLLFSPRVLANERPPNITRLLASCPGVLPVAVLNEQQRALPEELLILGRVGVRNVVDLSTRDGWNSLRDLVAHACDPATAQILEALMPLLAQSSASTRDFVQALVRTAPRVVTIQAFARTLGLLPSTLMSRFHRGGLPSPRRYLATTRLLYAASNFEPSSASIAIVANRLGYSSPQSFVRHFKRVMTITAGDFPLPSSAPTSP